MMGTSSRRHHFYGSIGFTVLLFNVLLVFLPVAAVFFLDTYEKQRLRDLELHLSEQARMVALSLEIGLAGRSREAEARGAAGDGLGSVARQMVGGLGRNHQARIRVFGAADGLLADSATLPAPASVALATPESKTSRAKAETAVADSAGLRGSLLYRIGSWPVRALRQLLGEPLASVPGTDSYDDHLSVTAAPELVAALAGRYGATTRIVATPGGSQVVLYSAWPVHGAGQVQGSTRVDGVVLVSQSTSRILADLYETRLDIFRIFLWSAAVALVLSLVLGLVLTRPLRRLSRQAAELLDGRGRLRGHFEPVRAHNEIGYLSASLADMSRKLERYTGFLESFSQDLAHEIRNPLAAIRVNLDNLLADEIDPGKRTTLQGALDDLGRINALVGTVRELGRIDTEPDNDETALVEARELLGRSCQAARSRWPARELVLEPGTGPVWLAGVDPGRFQQVVDNLLDNALSFAPVGSTVDVKLSPSDTAGTWYRLEVRDRGSGFPPEDASRLFDRFHSSRKQQGQHTGLGLAIVKSLVERWGGQVWAENANPGARFLVEIPAGTGQR